MKPALAAVSARIFHVALLLWVLFPAVRAEEPVPARQTLTATYKTAADQLIAASLADREGYDNLTYLCDRIGKRLSGSEPLGQAITWAEALMRKDGLAHVRTQAASVPHWVRGEEAGEIVAPVRKPLHLLGLGMSVGTGASGITADVIVVPDFAALEKQGRAVVQGKIVVFNAPYMGYGNTVTYRVDGASHAAALGAVGVLVRSITPLALQTPHTGTLEYDAAQPRVPAAAISIEDALMLERLQRQGSPVRVHLQMGARLEASVVQANVMGEIVGSEHPEQVVVLGGHIDSWDVGQGAQDDGSGIMATLAAVNVIRRSGLHPKRTIRIVFWVNEENGSAGAKAYRAALSDAELKAHVAALEMDGGAEQPIGWGFGVASGPRRAKPKDAAKATVKLSAGEQHSLALLREIGSLLKPVGADQIREGGGGTDIAPLMMDGVPAFDELTTGEHYFDWHHTEADTLDKVDPLEFRKNVASVAVMTYVLADMPETLTGHPGAGEGW